VTTQELQTLILVVMVANAVLIATALVSMRNRARREEEGELDVEGTHQTMLAMSVAGAGAGPLPAARQPDPMPELGEPSFLAASTNGTGAADDDGHAAPTTSTTPTADGTITLLDRETGLESAAAWRHAVGDEVDRLIRYHRPATVMLIELDGFERLTERLGEPAGARLVLATAKTLQAQARAADRCARYGPGRFAILMPETDEIAAINFAERIRAECDRWLEAGEVAMRVAIGWATIDPSQGATPAILEAEHRLNAERRQRAATAV
jgi:diguanylate cyclase (GGDEF)-like protein